MSRLSIRWRLTIWYGAVLASALGVFGVAVYLVMRHALQARTSAGLYMESIEVEEEVARTGSLSLLGPNLARRFAHHPGYDIQLGERGGTPLFLSARIREVGLPRPRSSPASAQVEFEDFQRGMGGRFRLLSRTIPGPDGPLLLQIAVPNEADYQELGELLAAIMIAGPLALIAALGGGYFLARKALAPVDRMASEADQITANRLDRRLEVSTSADELGRLAVTLNSMIARLEHSFEEIRRFTADAAHELRTPLAVIRNVAEVALRFPREPEHYRRILADVLEEVERLTRLAEQLLFLCREDAGRHPPARMHISLDLLTREVAEHMGVVAEAKSLSLAYGPLIASPVDGDPDQLRRLLFNLLDNAIKFTPEGGTIRVSVERPEGMARLTVEDTGIGIVDEHLPHIFERFYRVDPARGQESGGTGLGLAICRSIAAAHGGELRIESVVGQGTRAVFSMPTLPAVESVAGQAWLISEGPERNPG